MQGSNSFKKIAVDAAGWTEIVILWARDYCHEACESSLELVYVTVCRTTPPGARWHFVVRRVSLWRLPSGQGLEDVRYETRQGRARGTADANKPQAP